MVQRFTVRRFTSVWPAAFDGCRGGRLPGIARRNAGRVVLTMVIGMCVATAEVGAQGTEPVPMKVLRYARYVISQYDSTGDGRLSPEEWSRLEGVPASADRSGDGYLTVDDLAAYLSQYGSRRRIRLMPALVEGAIRLPSLLRGGEFAADSELAPFEEEGAWEGPSGESVMDDDEPGAGRRFTVSGMRLPAGLPRWFIERDLDGDGQVTLAEYAPTGSPARIEEFRAWDRDGDGVITVREALLGPDTGERRRVPRSQPAASGRPAAGAPRAATAADPEDWEEPTEGVDVSDDADVSDEVEVSEPEAEAEGSSESSRSSTGRRSRRSS